MNEFLTGQGLEAIDDKVLNYTITMLIQKEKIEEDGDHIKWP